MEKLMCYDCGTIYADRAARDADVGARAKAGMDPGDCRCPRLVHAPEPDCGHSVCSQNFIDTGETECVEACGDCERSYGPGARCRCNDDPTPYETSSGADPADTIRDSQVEAMRYKR